jgi:hypothetical protein
MLTNLRAGNDAKRLLNIRTMTEAAHQTMNNKQERPIRQGFKLLGWQHCQERSTPAEWNGARIEFTTLIKKITSTNILSKGRYKIE